MSRRGGEKRRWDNEGSSREGERRRSPRFNVCKSSKSSSSSHQNDDHSDKKSKKRSSAAADSDNTDTRSIKALPSSMDPEHKDHEAVHPDHHSANDKQLGLRSTPSQEDKGHLDQRDESWLPEKRTLELVLDTLQRRDTYEIFAEPVDPSEVEEYYEIIKEPMDFATMRAKLHEGMYKNLQQFEHDVFLIFGNAMHFNSSATVYFRQARALEELAKKVFHVLRTDPKNFQLEFAATRRRSSRGSLNYAELKGFSFGSCRKLERDLGSNNGSANIGRRGCKRQRRPFTTGIDLRSTYKPWCLLDEKCSKVSPIHHGQMPLIHVNNREEIGYKESLLLFVKDLGPIAQRVAKLKLQELQMRNPSNPAGANPSVDINKSREDPSKGSKPVQALGFSRFLCKWSLRDQADHMKQGNLVGNFDLNQVQGVSSDSNPETGCYKDDGFTSSAAVPMPGQFIFDLPYLKSRMREVNDVDYTGYSYKRLI